MNKFEKITDSFNAVDSNGREVTILKITEFIAAPTFGNPNPEPDEGLHYFKLADGSRLNKLSDAEFEIVATGEKLRIKN
jgi:hypothetical protein